MPEILIDVTRLLDRNMQGRLPTGVDRVSLEYVRHFGGIATALVRYAGQWVELSLRDSERIFEGLLSPDGLSNALIRIAVIKAFPASVCKRFSTPRFLFNTGHSGLEKLDYSDRLQNSGLKPLFFVHDLIPITHPEYCRSGEADKHRVRMDTVLKTGQGVITNSTATLAELTAYAKAHALPMPQAVVAHLAPARLPVPMADKPLNKPYFVMLGTIEPRKNHWLMLQLWPQLIGLMGATAPQLVIIGQQGWECDNVVALLERCEILKGFVTQQTACSDTELASWLHHSQALLLPSFAEGFGLPLLEAFAQGIPVIASNLPVFRETAGEIPDYVEPLDGMRWKALISDYAQVDSQAREAQCQRLKQFMTPTWDTHFEKVEVLMESLSAPTR